MNVDLEALCKIYLLFNDSEFGDRLDYEAEYKEMEMKRRLLRTHEGLSEEEAEEIAKTYRVGIMEGCLTVAGELWSLINIELSNETREFQESYGYLCPNCDNTLLIPKEVHVPTFRGNFVGWYDCPKCGFSYKFPKSLLVRDIFTEYAKENEKEKEKEEEE